MKKITIIAYSAFLLILAIYILFFKSLYENQIEYSYELLDRQVRIVGSDVDNTSMYIVSDLAEIDFSDNINLFFTEQDIKERVKERLKLYYSKYEDIIVSMMIYNNAGDVYTLFKDEEKNSWLDGTYRAQTQPQIYTSERLETEREKYKYYMPILSNGQTLGNIVIIIDLNKYFSRVFAKYHLEQYQWQWMVNDTGSVVFDNHLGKARYTELKKISGQLNEGIAGRQMHEVYENEDSKDIMSSFYPINVFGKDFGIVFSAPKDFFQRYIIGRGAMLGIGSTLVLVVMVLLFRKHFMKQKKQISETKDSETTLVTIIDQMPVGIVVYNPAREIVKVNRHAADLFSYENEEEMTGKLVPDLSRNEYVSDLSGQFGQGKIIRLPGANGDKIVFRNSIPVTFRGENATLEAFIDVTALESARKQEAEANIAKSELLARMSFEIRTPLNGIIGMTEMLKRADLPSEAADIARLLSHSADLLMNIINDIFDVSKFETGKMILDEIPFKLRDEINYCLNLVKRENPDTFVNFISRIEPKVPDNLIGDPYRLRQVITNLLHNSLGSTQTGEINLQCDVVEINGNVFTLGFNITDTGKTYTRAEIKRIFGDYITGAAGRDQWAEDLKLGPVLSRQLVELMGGKLVATSPAFKDNSGVEKGLKVSFEIKVHLNEKINKTLDLSKYTSISDIRSLVITGGESRDDDFLNIIHRIGLPVSVTSFQKYTTSQIDTDRRNNPDRYILLIIFDEPDSDGFVIAKALKTAGLTGDFIILMLTSNDPKGHYSKCVDMDVDHLLVKPFAGDDLLSVLKDHFPSLRNNGKKSSAKPKKALPSILVVDDNHLNRKVVGSLLKVLGITPDFAESGNEAVKKARETSFDIILMDLIMPDVDGFEAAKKIKQFDTASAIIALSADNMPETKTKAEQFGMKELLSKPVSVEDLRRIIDKYYVNI